MTRNEQHAVSQVMNEQQQNMRKEHSLEAGCTWEAQAAGDARHDSRDEVVEVPEGWGGQLEGAEADVVQCLIVQHHALVGVLHQLVH